jgi:hypothetical protein
VTGSFSLLFLVQWLKTIRGNATAAAAGLPPRSDTPTRPASREVELFEEQDRLEWEAGDEWFREHRRHG